MISIVLSVIFIVLYSNIKDEVSFLKSRFKRSNNELKSEIGRLKEAINNLNSKNIELEEMIRNKSDLEEKGVTLEEEKVQYESPKEKDLEEVEREVSLEDYKEDLINDFTPKDEGIISKDNLRASKEEVAHIKEDKGESDKESKLKGILSGKIFEPFDKAVWGRKLNFDFEKILNFEYWLNKIGIVLLLLGVTFLFKYSLDHGWVTPQIRVGIGFLIGLTLEAIGLKIYKRRRRFGQVLVGGGIATFYITAFAGFQLYQILPYSISFLFMLAVTIYAYYLSIKEEEVALSLIGFLGGMGTPFLLYTGGGNLSSLVLYISLIVGGSGLLYLYKGWYSLLWVSVLGSWPILFLGLNQSLTLSEKVSGQIAIVFFWLVFWGLPLIREILWSRDNEKWSKSDLEFLKEYLSFDIRIFIKRHINILVIWIPLISLLFSMKVWNVGYNILELGNNSLVWGLIALILSGVYLTISFWLEKVKMKDKGHKDTLKYIHILSSFILLTISLVILLEGNLLLVSLALEGLAMMAIGAKIDDKVMNFISHTIFVAVGVWLTLRFFDASIGLPLLNSKTIFDFIILASGIFTLRNIEDEGLTNIYKLFFGQIAVLAILWRDFAPISYDYILLTWTFVGLISYIWANKNRDDLIKLSSKITLTTAGIWVGYRLFMGTFLYYTTAYTHPPIFNISSLIDISVIVSLLGISKLLEKSGELIIFRVVPIFFILAFFFRELAPVAYNYVISSWVVVWLALIYINKKRGHSYLKRSSEVIFGLLTLWIGGRLVFEIVDGLSNNNTLWLISWNSLVALSFIIITLVLAYKVAHREKSLYLIIANTLLLGWLFNELLFLGYNYIMLSWLIEGVSLYIISKKKRDPYLEVNAHFVFGLLASFISVRIFGSSIGLPILDSISLVDITILLIGTGLMIKTASKDISIYYKLSSAVLALGIFWRELAPLNNGYSYIVISWSIVALLLYKDMGRDDNIYEERVFQIILSLLGIGVFYNIFSRRPELALLNIATLADLIVISFIGLYSKVKFNPNQRRFYKLYCHSAILALLYQEFITFQSGQSYITISWGIYGVVNLILGLRRDSKDFVRGGLAILFLVVAKLFIIDLSQLDAIWKIILFIGFGVLFLLISYYLQILWKPKLEEE